MAPKTESSAPVMYGRRRWEAHVQTVLIALTTAGILALVRQGWEMAQTQTKQTTAMQGVDGALVEIKGKLERLEARFLEFPTRAESDLRWRAVETRVDDHSRRLERLEDRIPRP